MDHDNQRAYSGLLSPETCVPGRMLDNTINAQSCGSAVRVTYLSNLTTEAFKNFRYSCFIFHLMILFLLKLQTGAELHVLPLLCLEKRARAGQK